MSIIESQRFWALNHKSNDLEISLLKIFVFVNFNFWYYHLRILQFTAMARCLHCFFFLWKKVVCSLSFLLSLAHSIPLSCLLLLPFSPWGQTPPSNPTQPFCFFPSSSKLKLQYSTVRTVQQEPIILTCLWSIGPWLMNAIK